MMVNEATMVSMDAYEVRYRNLRMLIEQMERESGRGGFARAGGLAMLAEKLGKQQAQVNHFASEKPIKNIGPKIAREIDAAFDHPPGWLDQPHWPEGTSSTVSDLDATPLHIAPSAFRRIPVVGTASLGMDGFWDDLQYPVGDGDGYFLFPTTDPDAYVLQVRGNSMHPAIRSGWYVAIEPNKRPQMGEFVMVKLADGRSTVKEFLWHRDGEYVLNAIATGERLVIDEEDVEAMHHVGGILPPSGRQG